MSRRFLNINPNFVKTMILRRFFATARIRLNGEVERLIASEEMKPRHQPGATERQPVVVPDHVQEAAVVGLGEVPPKKATRDGRALDRYLKGRHPPSESDKLKERFDRAEKLVDPLFNAEPKDEDHARKMEQAYGNKMRKTLKAIIYNWKAKNYDRRESVNYLAGRGAAEFAVLSRIFGEIKKRDASFVPSTFFDFGSGIGTGMWALLESWDNPIKEYFSVDVSNEMNQLSREIIQAAYSDRIKDENIFQRQFLPAIPRQYDLVLCSYSLFELPSAQSRLETIFNLWKKVGKYLVIVDHGTNAGFKMINEARDFILDLKDEQYVGHAFAPCPHNNFCPRFKDHTPCNFEVPYLDLKFTQRKHIYQEHYSYVVLAKGAKNKLDEWPRIVRPTLIRTRHTICRVCSAGGKLEELIITPTKHGKIAYRIARKSDWGDRLPIEILPPDPAT